MWLSKGRPFLLAQAQTQPIHAPAQHTHYKMALLKIVE